MTFTYDPVNPDDITRVRYWIQDTDEDIAIFDDETINFIISEEGSWQAATIALCEGIIQKLNREPDFQADWLRVDHKRALKGYEGMVARLRTKFSIPTSGRGAYQFVDRWDSQ